MGMITVIFRKELKDSLRDRRTIFMLIVLPLLMFPVMIGLTSSLIASHETRAQERTISVAVFTQGNADRFLDFIEAQAGFRLFQVEDQESAAELIRNDSLDAMIVFDPDFDMALRGMGTGHVVLFIKDTEETEIEQARLFDLLGEYTDELRAERFETLDLDVSIYNVVEVTTNNLATPQERIADVAGGILPYMFVIFCFMGAMYPAIDLAAGEKERGTLETLLTSPVSKLQILVGKLGVVILTGISSAAISLIGLYLGIRYISSIPAEFLDMVLSILKPGTIILLMTLLFPLTVFFAGVMLSLSFTAKSYKEAQSKLGPMMPVVIIPAFIGLMPGITFNGFTAIVPILNVTLATKQIIAGQADPLLLMMVYGSLVVYAAAALLICARVFSRESAIFS